MIVTGDAFLGGNLQLALLNNFLPSPASTLTIFDARSISGAFANIANGQRLPTTDGLGSFLVNYGPGSSFDPTRIVLSNFAPNINGDFDQDGDVDGNDFLVWQRGGSPNPNSPADLVAWKSNFGVGGATPATAAVPEPGSASLIVANMAAAAAVATRRRRTAGGSSGSSDQ